MKEARGKRINLPEIDPETPEGYLNWVYSRRQITLKHEGQSCPLCSKAEDTPVHFVGGLDLDVAKMYTLGDYLIDPQFCNAITDMLKPAACKGVLLPTADAVIWVWGRTTTDCPLRGYCLEIWKCGLSNQKRLSDSEKLLSEFPHEFMVDLLFLVVKRHKTEIKQDVITQLNRFEEKCNLYRHVDDLDECS
jgi:hypothetical protein